MNKDEALKMAQKALKVASRMLTEQHRFVLNGKEWGGSELKAIEEALVAEQVREAQGQGAVAWIVHEEGVRGLHWSHPKNGMIKAEPLYTHPHQWQGLTDDEVDDFMFQSCDAENGYSITDLIRLVEQALKEKNHG